MLQAFDTIMQCVVSADEVAKNNIAEPFRYECLCCGEEVHIAAALSKKRASHFRHLHGNRDKDCELYLGKILQTKTGLAGAVAVAQRRAHSRAEILFDLSQRIFYFSASFSEEKISEYEQEQCELQIKNGFGRETLESVKINRANFAPDAPVLFPLRLSSNSCLISIKNKSRLGSAQTALYEILKNIDFPTFFKIRINQEDDHMAKRHTDGLIYTDTKYYVIAMRQEFIQKLCRYSGVNVSAIDEISALGRIIYGAELVCSDVSKELFELFQYFGYCLRKAERVNLLWPPVASVDGVLCCKANAVFLSSTFDLRPKSNISCFPEDLQREGELYKVDLSNPIRISQSNGNIIQIEKNMSAPTIEPLTPTVDYATSLLIPDDSTYYGAGPAGYALLPPGRHYLTEHEHVIRFLGNYPIAEYVLPKNDAATAVRLLMNIRRYYKVLITYCDELLEGCQLSKVAQIYIEECRQTGTINTKVLEYIKAGKI